SGDAVAEVRRLNLVSARDEELEALLVVGRGAFGLAGKLECPAERPKRVGAKVGLGVGRSCEQGLETCCALGLLANEPESLERRGQVEATTGVLVVCASEDGRDA